MHPFLYRRNAERMFRLWITHFYGTISLSSKSLEFQVREIPRAMVRGRDLYLCVLVHTPILESFFNGVSLPSIAQTS